MYPTPAFMTQLNRRAQAPIAGPSTPPMGGWGPGQGQSQGGFLRQGIQGASGGTNMNPQLPYFNEDRDRLQGLLNGHNPFAGQEWGGLINQLQNSASGKNSIAEMQYRNASQDTVAGLGSIARGSGSAAAGRQALIQQGRVGQGLAAGSALARGQEMQGAQTALAQALGTRDQLNQGAYLDILAAQLGLSRAQLEALSGNADRKERGQTASKQAKAAKWGAIAGGAGALAML